METISTHVLTRWIKSCKTEEHLLVADRLVTLFVSRYGQTENYTRLCLELQLARINVTALNALNA